MCTLAGYRVKMNALPSQAMVNRIWLSFLVPRPLWGLPTLGMCLIPGVFKGELGDALGVSYFKLEGEMIWVFLLHVLLLRVTVRIFEELAMLGESRRV